LPTTPYRQHAAGQVIWTSSLIYMESPVLMGDALTRRFSQFLRAISLDIGTTLR
jgi:hypothetical protein